MKGDPKIIAALNKALKNELTAINQYFLHSRLLRHWGFERLSKYEHSESIDEMKRILFLDGLPNLQDLGKLLIGESIQEVLECDLKLEMQAHPDLKGAIAECERVGDYVSRELFAQILASEEEHIDCIETQLELIKSVGLQNYSQSQSGST
jgi:bacterioferritin